MYTKEELNNLYERVVKDIDISNELFDIAEKEYMELGEWIDKETPSNKVNIYPQGSFALGTVIKPIKGTDDYDLDLVCEFDFEHYLSPRALKHTIVKPLLERYKKTKDDIMEKRRCWHVEYEDLPNFHMDVVPAISLQKHIDITDHNEDTDEYTYIGSNPTGYIDWFRKRMTVIQKALREQYCIEHSDIIKCQADIETLKEYHYKTPLQKAIQILKRHRDIMFEKDENNSKPISIIITTIAGQLYNNEDNIVDTLTNILEKAPAYIESKKNDGVYHIDNPSYTGENIENFADKWVEHPERATAFITWIKKAKYDLVDQRVYGLFRNQMADNLIQALGQNTIERVFSNIAKEDRTAIENQTLKVSTLTGGISKNGTMPVPKNHNHGEI